MTRGRTAAAAARQFDTIFTGVYSRSPMAQALAREAERRGLGELRLAGVSPQLTYLVRGGPGPEVDALAAFGSVVFEASVAVLALDTLPEWRREPAWEGARVVPVRLSAAGGGNGPEDGQFGP